jgi:[ribosomal protein S5]-alanine N-acetyltransferase
MQAALEFSMSSKHELRDGDIVLRAPKPQDIADRVALGRDPEIVRMFGGDRPLQPITAEAASRWLDRLRDHPHAWVVEHEGHLLGEARLDGLNEHDARARLAMGLLDPAKLGKGLGRRVVHLVLCHAFGDLKLHRVDLRVLAYNVRAIRCYRRCGFVEEGREREAVLVAGERHDDIVMGILAREHIAADPGR